MDSRRWIKVRRTPILGGALLVAAVALAACGSSTPSGQAASKTTTTTHSKASSKHSNSATTTTACALNKSLDETGTLPVGSVCPSTGTPHFTTPAAAMAYLAKAWNEGNVQELDYVTDPAGRDQMNSMAPLMKNLQFKSCTENPAGDYTCYFMHDIAPTVSGTTYPDPEGYPPGEAVFTVAPAATPGWYLTEVEHCG
jgi:hypothetical protein